MPDNHQPLPDDPVDRAVAAIRQLPLPAGPSAAIVSRTLASMRQASSQPRPRILQRVIRMPRSFKVTAVLTSAATMLLVYAVLSSVTGGSALAFADVVEVLNKVRSAKWKITTEVKLPEGPTVTTSGIGMFLAPSHERIETNAMGATSIQIMDGTKDKSVCLSPQTKYAQVITLKNVPPGRDSTFGKTFDSLRRLISSAKEGGIVKAERLAGIHINGCPADGFRLETGAVQITIWADPTSGQPVRAEYVSRGSATGTHVVMSDFEVDVDLDPALFSLNVPDGYTITTTTELDMSKKPIMFLADALKMIAEINDGFFPPELRGKDGIDGIMQRSAAKLMKPEHTADGKVIMSSDAPTKLGGAFGLLFSLSPENNDWHYAGKDVKINTPDRPIFWYRKNKDSRVYDVLYADLSVKELPADQIPKADALPESSAESKLD